MFGKVNFMPIHMLNEAVGVLPIPGHLIVPNCFCLGRWTHTRDSGTVPGIPGQSLDADVQRHSTAQHYLNVVTIQLTEIVTTH